MMYQVDSLGSSSGRVRSLPAAETSVNREDQVTHSVVVLPGDGVGPELMHSVMSVVDEAGASIDWQVCDAGSTVFRDGIASGLPDETLDAIEGAGVVLKGPLETPIGFGEKSANVTLRKLFELYANIRPVKALPGISTPFAGRDIDFVVIRENVEDLYAGIEHMQTPDVAQCLKLISRKGSEKIARLAFALARAEGRRKVECATKANIMKLTEGLFKSTYESVAADHTEFQSGHLVVDNCAHKMVVAPESFDVLVTTNMNGDILSDLAAGLVGGLGLAPSANLGRHVAMFEAVHGSAPDIAGQGIANPTALMLSAVMMLRHIGEHEVADIVENALYCTLEDGTHLTADIARDADPVGTAAFAGAIIDNFGRNARQLENRKYQPLQMPDVVHGPLGEVSRDMTGVDVFIEWKGNADALGQSLETAIFGTGFRLSMISNRGTKVYPGRTSYTDTVNHWRCRFAWSDSDRSLGDADILSLLTRIGDIHRWMHVEKLQHFDGTPGYTMAQGENR